MREQKNKQTNKREEKKKKKNQGGGVLREDLESFPKMKVGNITLYGNEVLNIGWMKY